MKTKLDQFCINVTDLERSLHFYEKVLGLQIQGTYEIPGVKEVVLAGEDGSRIQLAQHLDHEGPIDHGNAFWKLYIRTDDCKGLYQRAIEAGSESVAEPKRLDQWPVTAAFIRDPDGYNIEILENHPE
jgi:lactoylglutathione lyase